jgi:nitrogen fixation-related uncharacterized protein
MMETIVILIIMLVAFNVATFLWGFDSRESVDSPEWARRRDRQASL